MINLFISSIEIELINELFYLKTKRLRSQSVFRMTLRLRSGYGLRVFESFLLFGVLFSINLGLTDRKAHFTLLVTDLVIW